MKKYVVPLLSILTLLVAVTGFTMMVGQPVHPYNCFGGFVYDRFHQPLTGVTVKLISPGGAVETFQTNDQGEYWFCRPYGGWSPGNYLITTGCCEAWRYWSGDGNIQVYFITPCSCM